jgi:hypothetical protein
MAIRYLDVPFDESHSSMTSMEGAQVCTGCAPLKEYDSFAQFANCKWLGGSTGPCVGEVSSLMPPSFNLPQRVDDFDAGEIFFVVGDDGASMGFGNGGYDGVECATRAALRFSVRHETGPYQARVLVER